MLQGLGEVHGGEKGRYSIVMVCKVNLLELRKDASRAGG